MAYVIEYDGHIDARPLPVKSKKRRIKLVSGLVFMSFIVAAWLITPVRVAVLDFLLPGDGEVTRRAASTMFLEMKEGQSFREAFSDFCIEIFENP